MMSASPSLKFSPGLDWEDFVRALVVASHPAVVNKQWSAPVFPLFSIRFGDLVAPAATRMLMKEIMYSNGVVDHGAPTKINDDTVGAMRQIHANDPRYLPRFNRTAGDLSERGKKYESYVISNKPHSNNRGGIAAADLTGYVEYTAGDNSMYNQGNRARIAWDYVHSLLYFSPLHYSCWTPKLPNAGKGTIVDKPLEGDFLNPWFLITDITQAG
jgi:hypothetical protein